MALSAANGKIDILRRLAKDADLLDLLQAEPVPASSTKLIRLDETSYVKDKMAFRQPTVVAAGNINQLLEAAADEGDDN